MKHLESPKATIIERDQIFKTIIEGNIEKAIDSLFKVCGNNITDVSNELAIISSNYNNLKKDGNTNIVDYDTIARERAKITKSLLEILNKVNFDLISEDVTKVQITLTIQKNFDEFSKKDEDYIYDIVKTFLNIEVSTELKIEKIRRGSVLMTLLLSINNAIKLFLETKKGTLEKFQITDANLDKIFMESSPTKPTLGGLTNFLDRVDYYELGFHLGIASDDGGLARVTEIIEITCKERLVYLNTIDSVNEPEDFQTSFKQFVQKEIEDLNSLIEREKSILSSFHWFDNTKRRMKRALVQLIEERIQRIKDILNKNYDLWDKIFEFEKEKSSGGVSLKYSRPAHYEVIDRKLHDIEALNVGYLYGENLRKNLEMGLYDNDNAKFKV